MKKIILLALLGLTSQGLLSQENSIRNSLAVGYHVAQYQRDFALGIDLCSPFFAGRHLAVRLRSNAAFHEHQNTLGFITWTPYMNVSLGVIGVGGMIAEKVRLYGEGGSILILPSSSFSTKTTELGGYGLFGFEFFLIPRLNYHIEIGGVGTGAVADKVPHRPIYSNGLFLQAGLRVQL